MLTRFLQTFVHIFLAVFALISWRTDALVVILAVNAGGSILTLIIFAVVDVPEGLADSLDDTGGAGAHEPDELLKGDLTIAINISQAEDGIDLHI